MRSVRGRPFAKNPPIAQRGRRQLPISTASRVLRELYEILRTQGLTYREVARRAGFAQQGLTRWARGESVPTVYTVECWAEALGYEVVLVKKAD